MAQLGWDLLIGMPWRSADIDDVIVNTFGAIVGYAVWRAATAFRNRLVELGPFGRRRIVGQRLEQRRRIGLHPHQLHRRMKFELQ